MGVPCVQILERTTGEADAGLEPSPDRPFTVGGLDPDQRPIRPRRFADRETAQHVAQVLRAVGYSVSVTPPLREAPSDDDPMALGSTVTRGARGGSRTGDSSAVK